MYVRPPPLWGELVELERPVGEGGQDAGVGGQGDALHGEPGDARGRLSCDGAVQETSCVVGECEGGRRGHFK